MSVDADGTRVEVYPGREAVVEFDPDLTFECVDERGAADTASCWTTRTRSGSSTDR